MKSDLHFHSIYSDGELTVDELLDILSFEKVPFACLTDHDTLTGSLEFYNKAKEKNIMSFPALELTTKEGSEDIHVLGYFKNPESISDEFFEFLEKQKNNRTERLKLMTQNLNKLYNLDLDFNNILSKHKYNLARPHLSEEIMSKLNISVKEVFSKYIGDSCPAYINSALISVKEGIDLIHRSNGLAILAHPYQYRKNDPMNLIDMGFDGVEVFYYPTSSKNYKKYLKVVKKKNLLATGGSDFHKSNDYAHSPIGNDEIPSPYIDEFIKRVNEL